MSSKEEFSTSVDSVDSEDLVELLKSLGFGRVGNSETEKGTINDLLATTESDSDGDNVAESCSYVLKQHSKDQPKKDSIDSVTTEKSDNEIEIIDLMSDEEDWNIATTSKPAKNRYIPDDDNKSADGGSSTGEEDEAPYIAQSVSNAIKTILSSPSIATKKVHFAKTRDALARSLFDTYNKTVFENKLPPSLEITWNKRLATTAGLTHYRRDTSTTTGVRYTARIELSCKVVDDSSKLERTLMHEMCHAAAWLIDNVAKPPHGPVFKKWAQHAMKAFPHLDVSTCHQYEIFYAYRWQCDSCNQMYGRHSNSIDVSKKVCGECRGRLIFLGKFKKDGDGLPVKQQRAPSTYNQFVKENFAFVKSQCDDDTPVKEVMKKLSTKWTEQKSKGESTSELDRKVSKYCSGLFERLQLQ